MSGIYILSDYGKLSKESSHLLYKDYNGNCQKILTNNIELLVLQGKVSITGDSLSLLAENKIPVYFMHNEHNISIDFGLSKNGFLRQKQYLLQSNEKSSLAIAKTIVSGKIKNQISFMQRLERSNNYNFDFQIAFLKEMENKVNKCKDKDNLRGIEGICAKYYFELFNFHIKPEWASFGTRSRRPPKTNVNAVLSYLYALLTSRIQIALESVGLDTMCSNLHEMTYGKESLVYDLMEEFRTPICDTLCCSLFNHGTLKEDDFRTVENDGIYLTNDGTKKVITAFENKLDQQIFYEPEDAETSYSKIFFYQARLYKMFVMGQLKQYVPFVMR